MKKENKNKCGKIIYPIKDLRYNTFEIFDSNEKFLFEVDYETLSKNLKSGFWVNGYD